jgi:iron-chelate-transporting ATPase
MAGLGQEMNVVSDVPATIGQIASSVTAADLPPLFTLEQVCFSVAGRILLEPLTMTLQSKRVIGLIGHNGSGKSTLVKILARQQPASAGTIRFEGRPLSDWGTRPFAQRLAYLPQHTPGLQGCWSRNWWRSGAIPGTARWATSAGPIGRRSSRR